MNTMFRLILLSWVVCFNMPVIRGEENRDDEAVYAILPIAPLNARLTEKFVRRITPYDEFLREEYPDEFSSNRRSHAGHLNADSVSGAGLPISEGDLDVRVERISVDQRLPSKAGSCLTAAGESLTADQIFVFRLIDLDALEKGDPVPEVQKLLKSTSVPELLASSRASRAVPAARHASSHIWNSVYQRNDGIFVFVKCRVTLLWDAHGKYHIEHIAVYSGEAHP